MFSNFIRVEHFSGKKYQILNKSSFNSDYLWQTEKKRYFINLRKNTVSDAFFSSMFMKWAWAYTLRFVSRFFRLEFVMKAKDETQFYCCGRTVCVCVSKTSIYISISMRDRFINTNELSRHRRLLERQNTQINRWIGRLHFKIKRKKQHSNWNDNRFFFCFVVNSFVWKWYLNSFIHSQYWCRAVTTLRGACIKQRSFYLQNDSTDDAISIVHF